MSLTNPDSVVTKQDLKDFYDEILPYLGGNLPVMGDIDRSMIFDTTEKVVGKWVDGRPVYMKTVSTGTLPNATSKTVAHNISNLGNVIDFKGWLVLNSQWFVMPAVSKNDVNKNIALSITTTDIKIDTGTNYSSVTTSYVTLFYTKTTDAANSFNYASENDYSTTEKVIGTWVNGEKLYQKTLSKAMGTAGTYEVYIIGHASSIYQVKSIDAILTDGSSTYPINHWDYQNGYGKLDGTLHVESTGKVIINVTTDWTGYTCYITLKYTKTS